jgi:cell wall assembly regulator SMI1
MQVALGRLDRWFLMNHTELYKELNDPASEKDLESVTKQTKIKLPIAMHALWRWRNGASGYGAFYQFNSFMDVSGALSSWQIMHDLIPQFEDEDGHKNWWRDGWLSFLENGGGDSIVLDTEGTFTGKKNQLVEFWHDDGPRTVLFPDLMTWAETFADSLEQGLWEVDEEEFELKKENAFKKLVKANANGYPKEFDADD